jgi:c-di-GMP phosphodiesterase
VPDVFVARQPIYDRDLGVVAYELLFRDGQTGHAAITDADAATSIVLLNAFSEIGLEALVGERLAFINVSRRFLLEEYAMPLPSDRVVLEILEDVVVDERLTALVARLTTSRYKVALDDFTYDPLLAPRSTWPRS